MSLKQHAQGEGFYGTLARAMRPPDPELRAMLQDLYSAMGGERALAEILKVSVRNVRAWRNRQCRLSDGAASLVWLTWVLLLHPERLKTLHDLVTWGRFRPPVTRPARHPTRSFRELQQPDFTDGDGI